MLINLETKPSSFSSKKNRQLNTCKYLLIYLHTPHTQYFDILIGFGSTFAKIILGVRSI